MFKSCNIYKSIIILVISILFSGCVGGLSNSSISYPKWYTQLNQDTNIILYSTAEAYTEKEAVTLALNNIASKISVSIESTYSSTTNSSRTTYSKNTQQNIKNSVQKIDFTSYKVLKKEQLSNNKFIVLVKVHKDILASSLQIKIDNNISRYKLAMADGFSNITAKIKSFQMLSEEIKNTESNVYILQSLDIHSNTQEYLSVLNNLQNKIDSFINNIKFKLLTNNRKDDFFDAITSVITQKGFTVVNRNEEITLKIKTSKRKINSLGYKILKVIVFIEARDKNTNRVIGQEKVIVGGKSISSFSQANNFAVQNFHDKLIKEKILQKLLGI